MINKRVTGNKQIQIKPPLDNFTLLVLGTNSAPRQLLMFVALTYLLTYLLTPCSRVLLDKLTESAASQEIPRIYGTRRFITVFTSARHLSLS